MKKKKIPLRKCVSCGENKPKKDLIRIVNNKETGIQVDLTGKMNGRGAYLCLDLDCVEKAKKNKKLEKALRTNIPEEIYEKVFELYNETKE